MLYTAEIKNLIDNANNDYVGSMGTVNEYLHS